MFGVWYLLMIDSPYKLDFTRFIVTGSREWNDSLRIVVETSLHKISTKYQFGMMINGAAGGVDRYATNWAHANGIHVAEVGALWGVYGNPAGPKRNKAMLTLLPTCGIAFPGNRGTNNMCELMDGMKIPYIDLRKDDFYVRNYPHK